MAGKARHVSFLSVTIVISCLLLAVNCTIPTTDFSDYEGKNYLPGITFASTTWSIDTAQEQSLGASAGTSSDPWFGYSRVDQETYGTTSGTNGFANSSALYSGLPVEAGTTPPVVRLEVKNLFLPGDFEGSWTPATGTPFTAGSANPANGMSVDTGVATADWLQLQPVGGDSFSLGTGNYLSFNFQTSTYAYFDFTDGTNIFPATAWAEAPGKGYNLGLRFDPGTSATVDLLLLLTMVPPNFATKPGPDPTDYTKPVQSSGTVSTFTFPKDSVYKGSNFTIPTSATAYYLYFNTDRNSSAKKPTLGGLDDLTVVQTSFTAEKKLSYRLVLPYAASGRPNLPQGGLYHVVFWVRNDPTAVSTAKLSPNRFQSASISVSLNDMPARGNTTSPAAYKTVTASNWDSWTKVTLDFPNLLTNFLVIAYPPIDPTHNFLELAISPCDLSSDANMFPGALLFTGIQLTWTSK